MDAEAVSAVDVEEDTVEVVVLMEAAVEVCNFITIIFTALLSIHSLVLQVIHE